MNLEYVQTAKERMKAMKRTINGISINKFNRKKIQELYPGAVMVMPMKVQALPKSKVKSPEEQTARITETRDYRGFVKKDGYWYQLEKTADGDIYIFSRNISRKTALLNEKSAWLPHIVEWAQKSLPNDTVVVGEVAYNDKRTSKDVNKIMLALAPKAVARQEKGGYLSYFIHDVIRYEGEWVGEEHFEDRYNKYLMGLARKDYKFETDYALSLTDYVPRSTSGNVYVLKGFGINLNEFMEKAFADGEEGVVFKRKDMIYEPDKKPAWKMVKFKQEMDPVDVVCTRIIPATKEYTGKELETWKYWEEDQPVTKLHYCGWAGSIGIGLMNKDGVVKEVGTVSSGLTEDNLIDMKESPDKYIGAALCVGGMSLDIKEKTIRHPKLLRWRLEDIDPSDCTFEKVFDNL